MNPGWRALKYQPRSSRVARCCPDFLLGGNRHMFVFCIRYPTRHCATVESRSTAPSNPVRLPSRSRTHSLKTLEQMYVLVPPPMRISRLFSLAAFGGCTPKDHYVDCTAPANGLFHPLASSNRPHPPCVLRCLQYMMVRAPKIGSPKNLCISSSL